MAENKSYQDYERELGRTRREQVLHKQLEEALQQSLARYDELVANVPVGVYVFWIRANGHLEFEYVSDRWCEIHQIKREDVLADATSVNSKVHPNEREDFQARNLKSFRDRIPFVWEGRFFIGEDQFRWLRIESTPTVLENGDIRWFGVTSDITERKQMEMQKLHMQKLESLGRLAGAVAHHYNNLLYVIIGNLQLTLDYMEEGRNPKEEITAALESAHRAAELGHQMLAYLGQTVVRYEQINLRDLLEQNHADLYKELPAQITLDLNLPQQPVPVKSNRELLGQVIHGLFTNACEAIGAKTGSIKITLEIVPAETIETPHRHPIDFEEGDGQFARLSVRDNGSGIPPEMVELIFDPFFSTKFTGRGLGLSVILGAIRNQGGCITVESTPGLGSTFRVYLPLVVEE